MTVIKLIESLSKFFDLQDDLSVLLSSGSLENETEKGKAEFYKIVLSINNTCEYLASFEKFCLLNSEQVAVENGEINLSLLQNRFYKLIKLTNVIDKRLKCDLTNKKLILKDKSVSLANIVYSYLPSVVSNPNDNIDINLSITNKTFLMGVMANYCFVCGLFDDGFMYQEIFEKELSEIGSKKIKGFVMPNHKRWE